MIKKILLNLLRIVVSVGLIIFLFWLMRGSLGDVASAIKKANIPLLLISLVCFVSSIMLQGVRLDAIMKAQNLDITLKEVIRLTFIGQFFSNFLPTSVGGDVVKAYYASRQTKKKIPSIACIFLDRVLGTVTLFIMLLVTCLFVKGAFLNKYIKVFLFITLAASIAVALVFFNKNIAKTFRPFVNKFKASKAIKHFYELVHNYKRHPGLLSGALLISALLQLISFFAAYLITISLHCPVPLKEVLLLMPIVCTMGMAPSISGLGVVEGSFVFFFGPFMGKEAAFALSILWRGCNFFVSLTGGVLYLFKKDHKIVTEIKEV